MAAIENLEIVVDVDISSAIAELEKLQEELQDLAEQIEMVDALGTEGINIRTHVDDLDTELARLMAEIEAFEATQSIDIPMDVHDRSVAEQIEAVDALGTEGIDIRTQVDNLDTELAKTAAQIEAFEATQSIDIPMNVHDRSVAEILGRAGAGSVAELTGRHKWDLGADLQGADLDFGGFNVGRTGGMGRKGGALPFRRLRRSLSKVTNKFGELGRRLDNFDIRMSDLHNLLAALVPLLVVFIGTLPAVITALVGLAAAAITAAASLGAIAGFGALGLALEDGQLNMDNLSEAWENIKQDFIDAFAPLAERLQPLFEDGLDALGRFFQQIANQGDALMELTDEARAFGQFIMDFVPGALRTLAAFVEALGPALSNIGRFIEDNFNYFMRELTRLTMNALPAVSEFIQILWSAIPTLVEIGIQFAEIATTVMHLIGFLWDVITLGGALDGMMGTLIGTILVAATAFSLLNKAVIQFAVKGIAMAIVALFNFFKGLMLTSNAMGYLAVTNIGRAISSIIAFAKSLSLGSASLGIFTASSYSAAIAAAAFWTAVTLGAAAFLIPMITSMATGFLGLSENIDAATSSLKEFDRVAGRTKGGFNPYGGDDPPTSGSGAASGGGGKTVINIESSGDPDEDKSNARYVSFRQGRTTGGEN